MSILSELNNLAMNKAAIKSAIINKNPSIDPTNALNQWSTSIASIPGPKVEQSKTVTPTAAGLIVTPDSGKTLSSVVINGDADLVAGNIKKDVEIFGVTGTYEGSGGGGGSNFLMAKTSEDLGTHDGTRVSDNVYENVTGASWDRGGSAYMYMEAYLSDGTMIRTGDVGSYNINLNGRTMFVTEFYVGCILKGTKVILADNSEKNIEEIKYNDELLVWDFDNGCLASAKPIWIKKAQKTDYWFLNKYKSGKILKTTGKSETGWGHRTFDLNKNKFIYTTESVSDNIFTLDEIDTHVSCERIEEPCEYYNIITERHFNLFANRILTSCSLNNLYPIKDMKYVKDNRALRDISEYDNIPQKWFDGLRLAENQVNPTKINQYVKNLLETGVK